MENNFKWLPVHCMTEKEKQWIFEAGEKISLSSGMGLLSCIQNSAEDFNFKII